MPHPYSLMLKPTLVVGDRGIGDMILAHSLLRALKAQEPDNPIDVVATPANEAIAGMFPEVREVLVLDNKPGEFDLKPRLALLREVRRRKYAKAYILRHYLKDALMPWLARIPQRIGWYGGEHRHLLLTHILPNELMSGHCARQLAALAYPAGSDFELLEPQLPHVTMEDKELPAEALEVLAAGPTAAICSGEVSPRGKMWPSSNYGAVLGWLAERGYGVLMLGSDDDREQAKQIIAASPAGAALADLTGKCSLLTSLAVLSRCRILIADDNGIMHASAAMGLPTLGIFHITLPDIWRPLGRQAYYIGPPRILSTLDGVASEEAIAKLSEML